jgi:two-component system, NarL family, sensor histidine kinase UhpB
LTSTSGKHYPEGAFLEKPVRILLVEDSEDDAQLLLRQLRKDGYTTVPKIVSTCHEFRLALENNDWDIIISDYVLPEFSGLQVLNMLQEKGLDIPCLIVSGKIDDETAVSAMKAGAKDYIMKDNLKRLSPAIKREMAEAEIRQERHLATRALIEEEKFSSTLLKSAPNPIVVAYPDNSIRYVNPAFENMTGYTPAEVIGLKPPYPWYPPTAFGKYKEQDKKGQSIDLNTVERQYRKKNGELFWVNLCIRVIRIDGAVKYFLAHWVDINEQKRLREERQHFTQQLIKAQEDERKRIARELHEDTAQTLSILKLELESLLNSKTITAQAALDKLGFLKENTDHAIQDIRRYSYALRPGDLDYLGLEVTLEQLAEDINVQGGLHTEITVNGEEKKLGGDTELVLFRIVQEALNNIIKHAQATQADINLEYLPDRVKMSISDDGKGFILEKESQSAISRGGLGLVSMKERAELIGGELSIKTHPGIGTVICVEVPLVERG